MARWVQCTNTLSNVILLLEKVRITEDQDNPTDGIYGHNSDQEKSQVAVQYPHVHNGLYLCITMDIMLIEDNGCV